MITPTEHWQTEIERVWRQPPNQSPSEWVEANLDLPSRVTSQPGRISFDRVPFWREPLDLMADPTVEDVIVVAGTQLGKTTFGMCCLLWQTVHLQFPALIVMPSSDMGRSYSESRLQPVMEENACIRDLMPTNKDKFKLLEMHMSTGPINLVGANSPSNIASRPVGFLVLDEVDKYPERTKTEAAAIQLAMERTKSYPLRKHLIFSSPTYADRGIWVYFLQGNQCHYHLPSPYAKGKTFTLQQRPTFELIQSKSGKIDIVASAKTARVLCPHTGQPILDGDKYDLLQAGKWIADNPDAPRKTRSYQISTFYSLEFTWEQIILKYLTEKQLPYGSQNFVNGWEGSPYEEALDEEVRPIPEGEYGMNHTWPEDKIKERVFTNDVQRDHFWGTVRLLLTDNRIVLGWAGRIDTYEDIEAMREKHKVSADLTFLDASFNKNEVLAQCAKYGWTAMCGDDRKFFYHQAPGQERVKRIHAPPQTEPAYNAGGMMVPVIQWSSQGGQDLLDFYQRSGLWSSAFDTPPDYKVQMRSHKKIHKTKKGRTYAEWDRIGKTPDHLWDCETMAIVALDALDVLPREMVIEEDEL
jgi:hypothetical protein